VHREKKRRGNTTIFVVDASGSMALQRLSEAKGAIEILLADCYVRRDRVAMIAFRGKGAEVLLDPTRSLVAAKRSLTALPGGGGSPVAAGLALAAQMVAQLKRMGDSTVVVVLTDGRANLTRDGQPGRQQAALEAQQMARLLAASADKRILIDTSMRPEPAAESIAAAMQGMYLAMPFAQAREMGKAVIAAQAKG
jgi:magnesium chelatase subunit D